MTWKPNANSWQCTCPYHVSEGVAATKCTRTRKERGPDTLRALKLWALEWSVSGPPGTLKGAHQRVKDAVLSSTLSEAELTVKRKKLRADHGLSAGSSSDSDSSSSPSDDNAD